MLAAGAALAVSGSVCAPAAPAVGSATVAAMSSAPGGVTLVKYRHKGGGGGKYYSRGRHRGYNNFWWGAPLIAAPFLYGAYDDGYYYRYGGRNSCYRACRYDHGPRFCRYHWEDYC